MVKNHARTRLSVAVVGGVLASLAFAPSAAARPDDAALVSGAVAGVAGCPLERIGDQFVRCDNLTGNGVPAPSYVPEWS